MSKIYSLVILAFIGSILFTSCKKDESVVIPMNQGRITGQISNSASFDVSDANVYLDRTYIFDSLYHPVYHLNAIVSRNPYKVLTLTLKGDLKAETYGLGSKKAQALYQIGSASTDIYTTTSDSSVISGMVSLSTYSMDTLIGTYNVTVKNTLGNQITVSGGTFNCTFVR